MHECVFRYFHFCNNYYWYTPVLKEDIYFLPLCFSLSVYVSLSVTSFRQISQQLIILTFLFRYVMGSTFVPNRRQRRVN